MSDGAVFAIWVVILFVIPIILGGVVEYLERRR